MKLVLCLGSVGLLGAALVPAPKAVSRELIVTGNYQGQLSPCGCTKPMSGGIKRLATLASVSEGVVVDSGGWVSGSGTQDVLKAETVAETLGGLRLGGALLTESERQLGEATVENLAGLMNTSWLTPGSPHEVDGLWIGGEGFAPANEAAEVSTFLSQRPAGLPAVWVTSRDLSGALALAKESPGVEVLVYRSSGSPDLSERSAGGTWLVSSGSKGKMAVEVSFRGQKPDTYRRLELTEDFPDEPRATKVFRTYLDRVKSADLLSRLPREDGPEFAGNEKCGSCHADALKSWKDSAHTHALKTLEDLTEDRDPDCVRCHVVGSGSTHGFTERAKTPHLANVGCESCHGAGAQHSFMPAQFKLPKVGLTVCATCHDVDHSPGFDPNEAWKAISHGSVDK